MKRKSIIFLLGSLILVMGIGNIAVGTPRFEVSLGLMGIGFFFMVAGAVRWLSKAETLKKPVRKSIESRVKMEVWRRDQGRCTECGTKERLEYDHIIPFSKGGSNTARNIQLLCEACNRKKSNKI